MCEALGRKKKDKSLPKSILPGTGLPVPPVTAAEIARLSPGAAQSPAACPLWAKGWITSVGDECRKGFFVP